MRTVWLSLLGLILLSNYVFGQRASSTKIYFYSIPSSSLTTTLNPDNPIKIGKCTLLETNADSLGLNIFKDKTIYIHFDQGRIYYFRRIGGGQYSYSTLSPCTEEDFWLNTYLSGGGIYRHYFLDKEAGLKLLEETK